MTIWYTSDQHFYHTRIIELCDRPFHEISHMNEIIINNYNSVVHPDDIVYMLGDFSLGDIDEGLKIVNRLNGHKKLMKGNHDRCFRGGKKSKGLMPSEWEKVYLDAGFESVSDSLSMVMPLVMLSHFPYAGDSHDVERYSEFRLPDNNIPLLHGHTHSTEIITYSPKGTLQINVGVDANNFYPINNERIYDMIENKEKK